jgi:hypothetical protein
LPCGGTSGALADHRSRTSSPGAAPSLRRCCACRENQVERPVPRSARAVISPVMRRRPLGKTSTLRRRRRAGASVRRCCRAGAAAALMIEELS